MAKDEFRQIERIEVNPRTGEKRTIYKAKGFEKLKDGKAITKILATFIAIITAFSIFTNLKQETPQTAFETFKSEQEGVIGWQDYTPKIPHFKVTLERLANSFESNLLPTLQLKIRREIIQDNWGAFNWLKNFINMALINTISLTTTITNIVITIVNSVFNVGQLLLSL